MARRDVPTCGLNDLVRDIRQRVTEGGWDTCIVVNDTSVVLGLLRSGELEGDADSSIEQAMRPGPSTFRPYVPIKEMAAFMTEHDLVSSPITTSDGRLVGLLNREDAQRAADEVRRSKGEEP